MQNSTIEQWYNIKFDANVVFFETWSDWSFGELLIIFEKDNKYYFNDDFDIWQPIEITEDYAIKLIENFNY